MEATQDVEVVNYCTFNQEQTYIQILIKHSCIAIGTNNGFKIVGVNPLTLLYSFGILKHKIIRGCISWYSGDAV